MRSRTRVVALVTGGLLLLGCTAAVASSTTVPVGCTITDNTLTCPLPAPPAPVTQTVTATTTVTAAAGPESLFGDATPATPADPDAQKVELGVKFKPAVNGVVTGVRFFKGDGNTGTHTGSLWTGTTRTATVTFAGETATGWQTAIFAKPVIVKAGTEYVASYLAPVGRYALEGGYPWPKVSGNLTGSGSVFKYGGGYPNETFGGSNYFVDPLFIATGTPTAPSTTATPTTATAPASTTAPATTTAASTTAPATSATTTTPASGDTCPAYRLIPAGPKPTGGCWPTPETVGVPKNITLTPYTGPMVIQTANTVIDSKTVNGELRILADNVTIRNSVINGNVRNDLQYFPGSFTLTDTTINVGDEPIRGLQEGNFVATRVVIVGGASAGLCVKNCTIQDSYVVGGYVDNTGVNHMSGFRMETDGIFRHNVIGCDAPDIAPDAGCSAGLTGYGDFQTVQNNVLENNLFLPGGGYCTYGGSSGQGGGKPYPNAHDIRFVSNRFVRGESGKCGFWGPITSFDSAAPGNVWQDNLYYPDGAVVQPAN